MRFKNKEEFWQFISMCEPGDSISTTVESLQEIANFSDVDNLLNIIETGSVITVFGNEKGGELEIKADRNRFIVRPEIKQFES